MDKKQGDEPNLELVSRSEITTSRWQTFMSKPVNRGVVFTVSGVTLLGVFLWAISEFFSIRGVVHMLTSRIFLGIACVTAWLLCALLRRLAQWPKGFVIVSGIVLIVAAVVLDRAFPMSRKAQGSIPLPGPVPISFRLGCELDSIPLHIPSATTIHILRINPNTLLAANTKPFFLDQGSLEDVSAAAASGSIDWPTIRDGKWMTEEEDTKWWKSGRGVPNPYVFKCTITSYTSSTLDEISAVLLVDTPDNKRHYYRISFDPIMSGRSYTFYVVNVCSSGVIPSLVQWDDNATVRVLGEEQSRKVPLRYEKRRWPSQLLEATHGPSSFIWNGVGECQWDK